MPLSSLTPGSCLGVGLGNCRQLEGRTDQSYVRWNLANFTAKDDLELILLEFLGQVAGGIAGPRLFCDDHETDAAEFLYRALLSLPVFQRPCP